MEKFIAKPPKAVLINLNMSNRVHQHNHLVGIGLDNKDEHKRITQAEQFSILGGSEETHEKMTETLCKTFEEMHKKGKNLETIEATELVDMISKNTPE